MLFARGYLLVLISTSLSLSGATAQSSPSSSALLPVDGISSKAGALESGPSPSASNIQPASSGYPLTVNVVPDQVYNASTVQTTQEGGEQVLLLCMLEPRPLKYYAADATGPLLLTGRLCFRICPRETKLMQEMIFIAIAPLSQLVVQVRRRIQRPRPPPRHIRYLQHLPLQRTPIIQSHLHHGLQQPVHPIQSHLRRPYHPMSRQTPRHHHPQQIILHPLKAIQSREVKIHLATLLALQRHCSPP